MQVNLQNVVDDAQCDDTGREWRWPEGRQCPCGDAKRVINRGFDDQEPARQRDECRAGEKRFDDLTDTIFAGPHQSLNVWIGCLSFMGVNWSTEHMAAALELDRRDVPEMTMPRREGIVKKRPTSRYLKRWRATKSLWWRVTKAIRWPWRRRDEKVVGIGGKVNVAEAHGRKRNLPCAGCGSGVVTWSVIGSKTFNK
jgi:hypothetical protein